jgi:MSHA biogenesis protein MshN
MSLINKVLRDLDRRNASTSEQAPPPKVRVVEGRAGGHEWFWRTVAGLVLIALGWVAWVVYQIQPRPIATELALAAAERKPAPRPPAPAKVEVAEAPKAQAAPAVAAPQAQVAPDTLRFSYSIETPIGARAAKPAATKRASEKAQTKDAHALEARGAPAAKNGRVERRDHVMSGAERAENEFRRGVDLLKRGRATEAEGLFTLALKSDAGHRGARQTLVALRLERNQLDEAARLLREGLAADPAQPEFAIALARVYVERAQYPAALEVLDASASAASNYVDYHVMRGTVLQRMGRHADAAAAYRTALSMQSSVPNAWMGLGISLEALQQKAAAADAFRKALASGPVSSELRTFAEQRIQALR